MIELILSAVRQQFSSLYTNFRIYDGDPFVYEKPKKVDGSEYALLLIALLYSASLTLSTTYENRVWSQLKTCEPVIPFGECPVGETEAKIEIITEYSTTQVWVALAVVIVAGTWSDKFGRQRKLLILIPIIGQIFSDSLRFVNHYWLCPYILHVIFTKVIPGIYVGRNLFWIGAMAYASENSTAELRTSKIAKLIGTYAISSLIGLGLIRMLDMEFTCLYNMYNHLLFTVPIFLNMMAVSIGVIFLNDTSEPYNNKNMLWIKPINMNDDYDKIFDSKPVNRAMVLKTLLSCQISVVVKIGVEYFAIMHFLIDSLRDDETTFFYFSISKTVAIVFGTLFSGVLSKYMNVHDLVIGILTCCLYIFAAICYVFVNRFYQLFLFAMIYFCHGSIIVTTTSLVSKMVEIGELGRLNSLQSVGATVLTLFIGEVSQACNRNETVHLCLMVLLYALLTVPMLLVFMFLYFKCKHLCEKEITTKETQTISIYSIT